METTPLSCYALVRGGGVCRTQPGLGLLSARAEVSLQPGDLGSSMCTRNMSASRLRDEAGAAAAILLVLMFLAPSSLPWLRAIRATLEVTRRVYLVTLCWPQGSIGAVVAPGGCLSPWDARRHAAWSGVTCVHPNVLRQLCQGPSVLQGTMTVAG